MLLGREEKTWVAQSTSRASPLPMESARRSQEESMEMCPMFLYDPLLPGQLLDLGLEPAPSFLLLYAGSLGAISSTLDRR